MPAQPKAHDADPPGPGVLAAVEVFARHALSRAAAFDAADRRLTVALGPVSMVVACHGAAMTDVAIRTLEHAEAGDPATADLAVTAIDSRSAGIERPPVWLFPVDGPRALTNRAVFDHGDLSVILNAEWRTWSVHDRAARRAVIWAGDVAGAPEWVVYDQIRNLLHALAAGQRWGLYHAAALRCAGLGLLLTGPSGSGKSTLTAAAVGAGMDTAGDDFVLIEMADAGPQAHAVFDTIKLTDRSLGFLPGLVDRIRNPVRRIEDKALIHLTEVAPERLATGFAVDAILHCRVTGEAESVIAPCAPALALRALAPSTVFLLKDRHEDIFRNCAALCRRLPTYAFAIGTDLAGAIDALHAFARGVR